MGWLENLREYRRRNRISTARAYVCNTGLSLIGFVREYPVDVRFAVLKSLAKDFNKKLEERYKNGKNKI